jgi:hypothetical protein
MIEFNGKFYDFDAIRERMDPELRDAARRITTDDQSWFDNYFEMHEEKFGRQFEVRADRDHTSQVLASVALFVMALYPAVENVLRMVQS